MNASARDALAAACEGRALNRSQTLNLIRTLPENGLRQLVAAAGSMAAGAEIRPFTCGIINAKSGRCGEDCSFCAQSRYHKTQTPVYGLLEAEKVYEHACRLAERNVTRMGIVTSGGGPSGRDFEALCRMAERITANLGIKLCASLGLLDRDQATSLRQAGFSSYHHNLETARSYYGAICTTHGYDLRVETVRRAKEAGLRVCSGGLFGLGESWEQRLELAETLHELDVDSIPINFLIPIPGTRLENATGLSVHDALALVAIFRLMHPGRDIVICGGRNRTLGEWDRVLAFAGANGLMVGDYLTTQGSPLDRDLEMLAQMEACCE